MKEQILTSPLWVRKQDDVIPEFKLLSLDDQNAEEVDKCMKTDDPPQNSSLNENGSENDEKKTVEEKESE